MPLRREPRAGSLPRQAKTLAGPLLVAFVEQRQIEQPFAGVVDDIERERAIRAVLPLVVDREPQLADVDRRIRPAPLLDQGADVALIVKTRYRVVGLRLGPRARYPRVGRSREHGEAT